VWCSAGVSPYHSSSVLDLHRCYDEINMVLQQIHEWATANGLKLNPEKSQVILIHRCRADIPLPTLLIGAIVVKVVPRVRNLGFVLNETYGFFDLRHILCAVSQKRIYWIMRCLRPLLHILRLRLEGDLFLRLFCRMSTMVIICLLVLIPHRRGGWGLHSRPVCVIYI
jgi:hypothetical protein